MSFKNVQAFCKDNSNTIFTVFGVILTIGAVAETVHATLKAKDELEEAEYEKWEDMGCPEGNDVDISLSPKETLKIAAPKYIGASVLVVGAIVCDIFSLKSSNKKIKDQAAMTALALQMLNTLKESVREVLPPRDIRKVESSVVHKMVEADRRNPKVAAKMAELQTQGPTTTIYRDAYSPKGCGIYLKGSMDQFRKAVHLFNGLLESYDIATVNDWYDCLFRVGIDIGHSDLGDILEFEKTTVPMELYAVCDYVNTDFDDNAVIAIGLRRSDTDNEHQSLAMPDTPRGTYGERKSY